MSSTFLPTNSNEMKALGWDQVDVVLISGDAYIDHPSFANALIGRVLQQAGFRVAILSQPQWKTVEPWREFGRPRLFFGVSAGNMDSMINHYTANKKVRNDDAYSPGGRIGLRPDRATLVYCQRAREAYPGVPVIAGGVEASLRRLAHYDYWSDTVKRSVLLDSKADLVVYGMGEKPIVEVAKRLAAGEGVAQLRDMRSVAYVLGAKESQDVLGAISLPSFEKVKEDKWQFVEMTRISHIHTNPHNAKTLIQRHGDQMVVVNPPAMPLSQSEMDAVYDLPFGRMPHPSYKEKIPAFEMIKDSITIMRGCFGGCTFCSITAHQGRIIQSRSQESIMKEVGVMASDPNFKGVISDIGGPTANMYEMKCTRPEIEQKCQRLSCVHPTVCKLLGTDHGPLVELMGKVRKHPKVKKAFVASGVRMDLAQRSPEYLRDLAKYHVGGHLKVAPEHTDPEVLRLMKKPEVSDFESFKEKFDSASREGGKPKQYLVPYFISSHPGSDINKMIELALFLKKNGYRPDQVQDFIPTPFDVATCMYHTGIDPISKTEVHVDKHLKNRKLQRALLQFFKLENYFQVRQALEMAGREDLIGSHCDALIPAFAPRQAVLSRRENAQRDAAGATGYRPGRTSAHRRERTTSSNPS